MQKLILDSTDQKILNLLAKDGRLSYRSVARKLDLTTKSIKTRVDKMVSGKVIKRFIVFVNPSIVGYNMMYSFILRQNKLSKDLSERISLVGHVQIQHRVLGGTVGYGIAVKEGMEDKLELLAESLKPALIVLEHSEYQPVSYELSNTDYRIIMQLLKHPRMEIFEIAKATLISPKTVRRRLNKMQKNHVVEFTILANPDTMKGQIAFFLSVSVERGLHNAVLERIYNELQEYFILPSVFSFQKNAIGVQLVSEDVAAIESIRSRIESLDGVKDASVFLPLDLEFHQDWIAAEIERKVAAEARKKTTQISVHS